MSLTFKHIELREGESFFIGVFQDNMEKSTWHYHPKLELTFVTEGSGKRLVGDSIEEFGPGDLIFIGKNIPHVWIPQENKYGTTHSRSLESVYMQFGDELIPDSLLGLPEMKNVRRAVRLSQRGVRITGRTLNRASSYMLELPYMGSFERMMNFYRILDEIGNSRELIHLASEEYVSGKFRSTNERISRIHEYMMAHYQENISLARLAGLVHMAPESLCRFFKSQMGASIFDYLNKIKVDYACKLLINPDLNISEIGYDCGFNNISHFNKQFKKVMKMTPSEYRTSLFY